MSAMQRPFWHKISDGSKTTALQVVAASEMMRLILEFLAK